MAESKDDETSISFTDFVNQSDCWMGNRCRQSKCPRRHPRDPVPRVGRPKWSWWRDPSVPVGIQTTTVDVAYLDGYHFQLRVPLTSPLMRLILSFLDDGSRLVFSAVSKAFNAKLPEIRFRLMLSIKNRLIANRCWGNWRDDDVVFCDQCSRVVKPICSLCGARRSSLGWRMDWDNYLLACTEKCATRLRHVPRGALPKDCSNAGVSFRHYIVGDFYQPYCETHKH